MRYSRDHKRATRARIVKKAAMRLREKGAHGVGVADVMKEAGLTHGGFYAHFESREALLSEAFSHAMDRSIARWNERPADANVERQLAEIVESYLSTRHRDTPAAGCALPALAADMARESPRTRRAASNKVDEMVDALAGKLIGLTPKVARQQAMAAMATMVGALLLSRVAGHGESSDDILAAARKTALAALRAPRLGERSTRHVTKASARKANAKTSTRH